LFADEFDISFLEITSQFPATLLTSFSVFVAVTITSCNLKSAESGISS